MGNYSFSHFSSWCYNTETKVNLNSGYYTHSACCKYSLCQEKDKIILLDLTGADDTFVFVPDTIWKNDKKKLLTMCSS